MEGVQAIADAMFIEFLIVFAGGVLTLVNTVFAIRFTLRALKKKDLRYDLVVYWALMLPPFVVGNAVYPSTIVIDYFLLSPIGLILLLVHYKCFVSGKAVSKNSAAKNGAGP